MNPVNDAPEVNEGVILYLQTDVNESFSYVLPSNLFTDIDGDEITVTVTQKPDWLNYDSQTRELSGNTPSTAITEAITIEATDSYDVTSLQTQIVISETQTVEGDNQLVFTGEKSDRIITNNGMNFVSANGGDDYIEGGEDADFFFGGTGNDYIDGKGGNDYINGNDGDE